MTDTRSAAGMYKSILWADNLISLSRHLRKERKTCKLRAGAWKTEGSMAQDLMWLFAQVPK